MSRQNPNVLDEMYSSPPTLLDRGPIGRESVYTSRNRDENIGNSGELGQRSWGVKDYHSPVISPRAGRVGGTSYLHQALNMRSRAQSSSPSSLVQLATRKGSGRGARLLKNGIGHSPVTVKLAGIKRKEEAILQVEAGAYSEERRLNPCDKEVVLSALRQKRKRWASTPEENDPSSSSFPVTSPPMAKRLRKEKLVLPQSPPSSVAATVDRKRSHVIPTTTVPAVKRSRVNEGRGPSNILSLHEMECEEEGFEVLKPVHSTVEKPAVPEVVANGLSNGRGSRGMTPPILIDEAEIDRKRDKSLGALKAVFTSPLEAEREDNLRRKLPIFCATGTKPHLPSPLSATHSVTLGDLKKDREAIAARFKAFLEADDEPDGGSSSRTESLPASNLSSEMKPTSTGVGVASAAESASTGLNLASVSKGVSQVSSLPGVGVPTSQSASLPVLNVIATTCVDKSSAKVVSFAPLPGSSQIPSLTSTTSATATATATAAVVTGPLSQAPLMQAPLMQAPLSQAPLQIGPSTQLGLPASQQLLQGQAASGATLFSQTTSMSSAASNGTAHTAVSSFPASTTARTATSAAQAGSLPGIAPVTTSLQPTAAFTPQPATAQPPGNPTRLLTHGSGMALPKGLQLSLPQTSASGFLAVQTSQPGGQPSIFRPVSQPSFNLQPTSQQALTTVNKTSASPSPFNPNSQAPNLSLFAKASLPKSQPSQNTQSISSLFNQNTQPTAQNALPTQLSLLNQSTQPNSQPFLYNQPIAQPTQLSTQTNASLFNQPSTLPVNAQPPFFTQPGTQTTASLFNQSTQPSTLPVNAQPSLFQSGAQPSLFQATAQPSLFQTTQPSSQPSLLQATQSTAQPSLFQSGSQPSPYQGNNQPSLFNKNTQKPSVFSQGTSTARNVNSVLGSNPATSQPIAFNFSTGASQGKAAVVAPTGMLGGSQAAATGGSLFGGMQAAGAGSKQGFQFQLTSGVANNQGVASNPLVSASSQNPQLNNVFNVATGPATPSKPLGGAGGVFSGQTFQFGSSGGGGGSSNGGQQQSKAPFSFGSQQQTTNMFAGGIQPNMFAAPSPSVAGGIQPNIFAAPSPSVAFSANTDTSTPSGRRMGKPKTRRKKMT